MKVRINFDKELDLKDRQAKQLLSIIAKKGLQIQVRVWKPFPWEIKFTINNWGKYAK